RPVQVTEGWSTPKARTTQIGYDPVGNVLWTQDPRGAISSFGYDALDRRTTAVRDWGTGRPNRTATHLYGKAGAVLTMTASPGNAIPHRATTSYGYAPADRNNVIIRGWGSAAPETTQVDYDLAGNVRSVTDPRGTVTSFGYDKLDRATTVIRDY